MAYGDLSRVVRLRVSEADHELIEQYAKQTNQSVSQVLREFIAKGLNKKS